MNDYENSYIVQSCWCDESLHLVKHPHHCHLRSRLIFISSGCVHWDTTSRKEHLTVRLWRDDYSIGTAHINFVGLDQPNRLEVARVESVTVDYPPKWLREPCN